MSLEFSGSGEIPGRAWHRREDRVIAARPAGDAAPLALGHPGAYEAAPEVVDAVNTALLLDKPLLVTGRPGTGKTELAERIAYEFDLGAVQRFECQSLSEAADLFYRFDHVGQMVAARLEGAAQRRGRDVSDDSRGRDGADDDSDPRARTVMPFVHFGPLGRAILRSAPAERAKLPLPPDPSPARRSVVLIDEIDKASRDFPNDLLNGIERLQFVLRELGNCELAGADRSGSRAASDTGPDLHPIVVITSNSERELPDPFLRRCVYIDIPPPGRAQLAAIVARRLFGLSGGSGTIELPDFYSRLLDAFIELRDKTALSYRIGTSELLDLAIAAQRREIAGDARDAASLEVLLRAVTAVAKHPRDRQTIVDLLRQRLAPPAARGA